MTNLQEILQAFSKNERRRAGEFISGTHISEDQAQAAIAELVDKCIGPDEPIADIKWQLKNPTKDPYERNKLKAEIRNNLIKVGVLNG